MNTLPIPSSQADSSRKRRRSQGWLRWCGWPCAATREPLTSLERWLSLPVKEGKPTRLSDQVLTITYYFRQFWFLLAWRWIYHWQFIYLNWLETLRSFRNSFVALAWSFVLLFEVLTHTFLLLQSNRFLIPVHWDHKNTAISCFTLPIIIFQLLVAHYSTSCRQTLTVCIAPSWNSVKKFLLS